MVFPGNRYVGRGGKRSLVGNYTAFSRDGMTFCGVQPAALAPKSKSAGAECVSVGIKIQTQDAEYLSQGLVRAFAGAANIFVAPSNHFASKDKCLVSSLAPPFLAETEYYMEIRNSGKGCDCSGFLEFQIQIRTVLTIAIPSSDRPQGLGKKFAKEKLTNGSNRTASVRRKTSRLSCCVRVVELV